MLLAQLNQLTPYITIIVVFAGGVALLDVVVRDAHKTRLWQRVLTCARIGERPLSFGFYCSCIVASAFLTLVIVATSGILEEKQGGSAVVALKSSGPLLFAVIGKVLVFDYLLALKSSFLTRGFPRPDERGLRAIARGIAFGSVIAGDILATGFLTALFLNWSEMFQAIHLPEALETAPKSVRSLASFFDTINLAIKDSISKSFYALNGTLILYATQLISGAAGLAVRHLNTDGIEKNIFKILASGFTMLVGIVVVARWLTSR